MGRLSLFPDPRPAMKLAGSLGSGSPELRLTLGIALKMEIERHRITDEILQSCLIDLFAFMDVDSTPDVSGEAGVE